MSRDALQVFPRLASVRLLYVAKRRRDKRRERVARAVYFIAAGVVLPLVLFYAGSN